MPRKSNLKKNIVIAMEAKEREGIGSECAKEALLA